MAKKKKYRLQVILFLKEKAKKRAELELAKAIKRLADEKKKLEKLKEEQRKIEEHIADEKIKMRNKVAGGDAKMKDPQVHLNFIRKLEEDLAEAIKRVEEQTEEVKKAERHLQKCRANYILAAQEHNMMEKHKELWEKKQERALSLAENKVLNELGNTIYQMNKMR
jgi:flagellar export protein FliJ